MDYREHQPHPNLRDSVRCYWSLSSLHTSATEQHWFYPESVVRLVFYSGEAYMDDAAGQLKPLEPVYALGLRDAATSMVSKGMTHALGVELYPWGALRLLDLQRGSLNVFERDLGQRCRSLAKSIEQLLKAGDLLEALELLEAWLLGLAGNAPQEPTTAIEAATLLYASHGSGKITEIAETLQISVRQLERGFASDIGLPPKALARVIRFERAYHQLLHAPPQNLSQLALDLGYADQAHLTREFQDFALTTPAAFAKMAQSRQRRAHMNVGPDVTSAPVLEFPSVSQLGVAFVQARMTGERLA